MGEPSRREASSPDIGGYYDRLGLWTRLARPFGYGGGAQELTVHRLLADPRAGGRPTSTRVHDLIVELLPRLDRPRILDAGCGLGGTMLDLASRLHGTAVGLTLSASQRRQALRASEARGLQSRVEVLLQSYDTPPAGPFDLIVAIESLAHSQDPVRSVASLAAVLAPGGSLVVVDDMPEPLAAGSDDLAAFRHGWQAPVVLGRAEYLLAFGRAGLLLSEERDLTSGMQVRSAAGIGRLARVNRWVYAALPFGGLRRVLDSYLGGLALERMYRARAMRYRLLVASRPG